MLLWEFEHHAQLTRQLWEWRALRADGRIYRKCSRPLASFMEAFDDASRHGFDRNRHGWTLATPTYHPGPNPVISRRKQQGKWSPRRPRKRVTA